MSAQGAMLEALVYCARLGNTGSDSQDIFFGYIVVMQGLLKRHMSELHSAYFKPNGFKKEPHRFRRNVNTAVQEVEFQSSQWNSTGEPVTFYVNILVGFTDIPINDDKPALAGRGRIAGLVSDANPSSELGSTPGGQVTSFQGLFFVFVFEVDGRITYDMDCLLPITGLFQFPVKGLDFIHDFKFLGLGGKALQIVDN